MYTTFTRLISRYRNNVRGGVALMAGLSFPVIFLGIGGAVDYTQAVSNKQKAQSAMDSVVLALTRMDQENVDIQVEGEKLFRSSIASRDIKAAPVTMTFVTGENGKITGTADLETKNLFLGIVGKRNFLAGVRSAAIPPARQPIEIALVLDVSGSMSNDLNGATRIEQMKTAVNSMFDTLDESLIPGTKLSVSVVPYSSSVNLSDYRSALKPASLSGKGKDPAAGDVWAAERMVASNGNRYTVDDTPPTGRGVPFVTADEMSAALPAARMAALTEDLAAVRQTVSGFAPNGWTAGHIGMAWGVYSLSPNWKNFWPTAPADYGKADKIIVLLSDGEFNTTFNIGDSVYLDASTGLNGQNDNQAEADAYFQDMCEVARDTGITIYAVALNLDTASEDKLNDCVGAEGKVYPADTASALSNAFEAIALKLGQRRLTS